MTFFFTSQLPYSLFTSLLNCQISGICTFQNVINSPYLNLGRARISDDQFSFTNLICRAPVNNEIPVQAPLLIKSFSELIKMCFISYVLHNIKKWRYHVENRHPIFINEIFQNSTRNIEYHTEPLYSIQISRLKSSALNYCRFQNRCCLERQIAGFFELVVDLATMLIL